MFSSCLERKSPLRCVRVNCIQNISIRATISSYLPFTNSEDFDGFRIVSRAQSVSVRAVKAATPGGDLSIREQCYDRRSVTGKV